MREAILLMNTGGAEAAQRFSFFQERGPVFGGGCHFSNPNGIHTQEEGLDEMKEQQEGNETNWR